MIILIVSTFIFKVIFTVVDTLGNKQVIGLKISTKYKMYDLKIRIVYKL